MARITLLPEQFSLVEYDAAEVVAVVEEAAALVGFPTDVDVVVEVDEELFAPLVGCSADVVDGRAHVWISGANLEDVTRPRHFSADRSRLDFVIALLRAKDRLGPDFADAPADAELTLAERTAWDAWSEGRAERLGVPTRRQRRLYDYRLQHGFTDVADAVFDRLWAADTVTWAGIREACKETGASDRPAARVAADLLRQRP
ncbi:MAG TPA: hypothetical protein VFZ83_01960 [Acidimicrobiia bacterium]|nr:hypothetical protein [Acidimicrobiia bacterium]